MNATDEQVNIDKQRSRAGLYFKLGLVAIFSTLLVIIPLLLWPAAQAGYLLGYLAAMVALAACLFSLAISRLTWVARASQSHQARLQAQGTLLTLRLDNLEDTSHTINSKPVVRATLSDPQQPDHAYVVTEPVSPVQLRLMPIGAMVQILSMDEGKQLRFAFNLAAPLGRPLP